MEMEGCMKKKNVFIVLGFVAVILFVFFVCPGVRIIGNCAYFNVDEEFYLYDVENEEIIGTVPVEIKGFYEGFTNTFRGTACAQGYELEYPDPKNYGHLDQEELVFRMNDSEIVFNEYSDFEFLYGKYNYHINVRRNYENRIIYSIFTQNEGFTESGGTYSTRYQAIQAKDVPEAMELLEAYRAEMEKKYQ